MIYERYSSPIRDKAEKHYGRIWTFRDITERRKQEENLRQSQKMEALGQLSGGIAHDFNNILTVILGCAEFLGEEVKLDERLHRMAEMIVDAARRGADVTRRMLAFARRQNLQPKAIDVNRLLGGIESFLRRALTSEIELEVVEREQECVAIADRSQLENALLNLCVNARDAMPRGGKLIVEASKRALDEDYAAVHPEVEPGEYILIDVTDTGTGISPEILGKVFDPFFTTKEVGKGTGLGLSMVYGFVKQSHGHVRIYSELGHGTSVKIYLPRAKEAAGEERKRVPQIEELRGSETILLVEDDAAVREYATTQLKSLGYTVLEASNGKDALKQLESHAEIDMLFTDIVMPGGMDGCELGRQARVLHPTLAVLHCSGYAESAFGRDGAVDEDIEVLSKPYTRLEVAERIRKVLEKGKK
jgi:nitrogen-specific signal transduction histidine kinase/ActR/RegA family two-component response regulator